MTEGWRQPPVTASGKRTAVVAVAFLAAWIMVVIIVGSVIPIPERPLPSGLTCSGVPRFECEFQGRYHLLGDDPNVIAVHVACSVPKCDETNGTADVKISRSDGTVSASMSTWSGTSPAPTSS